MFATRMTSVALQILRWLDKDNEKRGAILMLLCWLTAFCFPASTSSLIAAGCAIPGSFVLVFILGAVRDSFSLGVEMEYREIAGKLMKLLFPIISMGALLHFVGGMMLGVNNK